LPATPSLKKKADVEYLAWAVYEVTVSQNDTITLPEFVNNVTLAQALLIQESDGATVTTTKSNNIVTVTQAVSNLPCILFAAGIKS